MFYSALHSVLMSWGDVRPAVAALAEASQSENWSLEEISATATNTLKLLGQNGDPRADAVAWRYFDALLLHDVMDTFHINTMLGLCTSADQIEKVIGAAGLWSPSRPSRYSSSHRGQLMDGNDRELTYELASRAWLRIGHVEHAASTLAESSASVGGWGKKKLRRKVVSQLRALFEDAASNKDDALHEKAQAYFFALHGRGLTDQHSCKLVLRWCRDDGSGQGTEAAAIREAIEQAGMSADGIHPGQRHRK